MGGNAIWPIEKTGTSTDGVTRQRKYRFDVIITDVCCDVISLCENWRNIRATRLYRNRIRPATGWIVIQLPARKCSNFFFTAPKCALSKEIIQTGRLNYLWSGEASSRANPGDRKRGRGPVTSKCQTRRHLVFGTLEKKR